MTEREVGGMEEGPIEPLDGTKRRWRVPTGTAIQCENGGAKLDHSAAV